VRSRIEFGVALLLDLVGAGTALLISVRHWQTVHLVRPRPLADQAFGITGRTVDAGPTALAIVALAGVVAVLAVRGWARRGVGVVLALTGAALVWRSLDDRGAISLARAVELRKVQGVDVVLPGSGVTVTAVWPWLSAGCGVLVLLAGVAVAARGHTWAGMSARYDAPSTAASPASGPITDSPIAQDDIDEATARARADASLWRALDAGDDPTARDERSH
jgi:uncharacterized membrane protein (TIGR02234 family)